MPTIPELLNGHVTLEIESLDRVYLNGYIGPLATSGGLVTFMREQLKKPIPSPVVLGQLTEKFRESVKGLADRQQIPRKVKKLERAERKGSMMGSFHVQHTSCASVGLCYRNGQSAAPATE